MRTGIRGNPRGALAHAPQKLSAALGNQMATPHGRAAAAASTEVHRRTREGEITRRTPRCTALVLSMLGELVPLGSFQTRPAPSERVAAAKMSNRRAKTLPVNRS